MTIPEVRHCLVALAGRIEAGEAGDPQETAAILRHLAEQTRRAPRGSRKGGGVDEPETPPERQAGATLEAAE